MDEDEARKLVELLKLDEEIANSLQEIPYCGSLVESLPVNPLIYRFYRSNASIWNIYEINHS
ncbi:hypothetical protein [Pseudogracilibacillus sp. SO30301A]|uniref:hypothetical protein n=1 Tax=Pseudogracilibacillus sp. SO30301A TaxID=3098291 RepID=UPI00300E1FD0